MEATTHAMDEASALIAWGRQVLVNRRLQRQRERLQREVSHDGDAAHVLNPVVAPRPAMPEAPATCARDGVASPPISQDFVPEGHREQRPLACRGGRDGVAPSHPDSPPRASVARQETVEAAHLRRRVEVAKQSLQELRELDTHNEEVFQRRMQELQGVLEQIEHQKQANHHAATRSPEKNAVGRSSCGSTASAAPTPRQNREHGQKFSRKEQLEELWSLQKALLKSLHDEKLAGVAVASLAACAGDVPNWDDRLWCLLRQAIHDWKLRLVPSLQHFRDLVQKLPMLQEEEENEEEDKKPSPMMRSASQSCEHAVAAESFISPLTGPMMLPAEKDYPALEWLDKLPVQEAIGVVIDVLARAGADTEASLASIIKLSDQKDVQLARLLREAEERLKQQEDMLEEAHALIGRLQREKASLNEDGAALHDAVEVLQEKIVSLRAQHEDRQRQETEMEEEAQKHQMRLAELKQRLEREASLRNDAVVRTDEATRSAENAVLQTTLLQDELRRAAERKKGLEEEVLQLQRLLRVAKEEEGEAIARRQRQADELRVAHAVLQASREALLRQRQKHEADQKMSVSIRCSEHEVLGQITAEEEACKNLVNEIEKQRGVETVLREELATLQSELLGAETEMADVRRSLHIINEKIEAAQTALLYSNEVPDAAREAGAVFSPSASASQQNLVEVLRPKPGNFKGDKSPAAPDLNASSDSKAASSRHTKMSQLSKQEQQHRAIRTPPQPCSNAAEVTLTSRGVQREQEEQRLAEPHSRVRGPRWREEQQQDGVGPSVTVRSRNSSLLSPGDGSVQGAPLIVSLPSRRDGPL